MGPIKRALDHTLASLAPALRHLKNRKLILCYHRLFRDPTQVHFYNPVTALAIDKFEAQMRWLSGFCQFQTLDELIASDDNVEEWQVAITFDDGYRDNVELGLPVFEKYHIPATWFVATAYLEEPQRLPWWDLVNYLQLSTERGRPFEQLAQSVLRQGDQSAPDNGATERLCQRLAHLNQVGPRSEALTLSQAVEHALSEQGVLPRNEMATVEQLQQASTSPWLHIAPHTHTHPNLNLLSSSEQAAEIDISMKRLHAWGIETIPWFAYPFGKAKARTPETPVLVRQLGLHGAVTTDAEYLNNDSHPFLLPRFSVDGRWNLSTFKARVLSGPPLLRLKRRLKPHLNS